jgi:hypothetical protein
MGGQMLDVEADRCEHADNAEQGSVFVFTEDVEVAVHGDLQKMKKATGGFSRPVASSDLVPSKSPQAGPRIA